MSWHVGRRSSTYQRLIDRHEERWAWRFDDPDQDACGDGLKLLDPREQRMLGKSALALWMEMERERGWCARWTFMSVKRFAARIGMSYETAKFALRRLIKCGAVDARRQRTPYQVGNTGTPVAYRVWGTFDVRDGVLRAFLPAAPLFAWMQNRRPQGRQRKQVLTEIGAPSFPETLTRKHYPSLQEKSRTEAGSYAQTLPLYKSKSIINILTLDCSSPDGEEPRPVEPGRSLFHFGEDAEVDDLDGPSKPEDAQPSEPRTPLTIEEAIARIDAAIAASPPRKRLVPRNCPPPVLPPLDPVPREVVQPMSLEEGMPPEFYAVSLASAYNSAVRSVFNLRGFSVKSGNIAKSKLFPLLVECAEEMIAHDVPPRAWCEWVMQKTKERGSKRPPPMKQVFSPNYVRKRAGWFRKDYDGPSGWRPVIDRVHLEQLFRRQEADALWRGMTQRGAWMSKPPWYAEMREEEIKMGYADPLELWPRAKGVKR